MDQFLPATSFHRVWKQRMIFDYLKVGWQTMYCEIRKVCEFQIPASTELHVNTGAFISWCISNGCSPATTAVSIARHRERGALKAENIFCPFTESFDPLKSRQKGGSYGRCLWRCVWDLPTRHVSAPHCRMQENHSSDVVPKTGRKGK